MNTYPHKYEVVIDRKNVRTGRPLVSVSRYKGNDEKEARAAYDEAVRLGRVCGITGIRFETRELHAHLR